MLIQDQPDPTIFFKVFLELGCKCMVSYLAFDYRSIKELLDDKNNKYFSHKFPIFYMNQDGRSAIDIALEHNQIRSINLMIDYIVKYQNSYVYSHLFIHNLVLLLQKKVALINLFESSVMLYSFDYDEWPATHPNKVTMKGPYNRSILALRY